MPLQVLVYFVFIMVGMFGELAGNAKTMVDIAVHWSPYGVVKRIVADSLNPSATGIMDTTYALLATIGYTIVFAALGIKKFKWNVK